MKVKAVIVAAVLVCLPIVSHAAVEVPESFWNQSRTSDGGGGLTATGAWDLGGFSIEWSASYSLETLKYTYSYDINVVAGAGGKQKEISHWILELTKEDKYGTSLQSYWEDVFIVENGYTNAEIGDWSATSQGASNPGMPASGVYGVKFNLGTGLSDHIQFTTFNEPVWGDFYAKDGVDGEDILYVYNDGFGVSDDQVPVDFPVGYDPDVDPFPWQPWIARPDGLGSLGVIPEPGTLTIWIIGSGLVGAGALTRR